MGFALWQHFNAVGVAFAVKQTINNNFVGGNFTLYPARGTDDQGFVADNFALDITVNLYIAA